MQNYDQTKTLFNMQSELIDTKIDASVNKSINMVVEQIISLKQEMHKEISSLRSEMQREIGGLRSEMQQEIGGLRNEMHGFKIDLGQRLSAVETALGLRSQVHAAIRNRFLDYSFKAGWLLMLTLPNFIVSIFLLSRFLNFN